MGPPSAQITQTPNRQWAGAPIVVYASPKDTDMFVCTILSVLSSYEPSWLAVLGRRRKNNIYSFIHSLIQKAKAKIPLVSKPDLDRGGIWVQD